MQTFVGKAVPVSSHGKKKKKREAAVAVIVRISILCSGCTFDLNPQSHLNGVLSPVNRSGLKEKFVFKGHRM